MVWLWTCLAHRYLPFPIIFLVPLLKCACEDIILTRKMNDSPALQISHILFGRQTSYFVLFWGDIYISTLLCRIFCFIISSFTHELYNLAIFCFAWTKNVIKKFFITTKNLYWLTNEFSVPFTTICQDGTLFFSWNGRSRSANDISIIRCRI